MQMQKLKRGWLNHQKQLVITSPFGPRKWAGRSFHHGVDIRAKVGTPIYAAFSGTFTCWGVSDTAGLWGTLTSGNICLVFMHLTKTIVGESRGASRAVAEGDEIAKSGGAPGRLSGIKSGTSGPHLHFEYRKLKNGKAPGSGKDAINPVFILSEKLINKNNVVLSQGVQLKIDKKTGKEETYDVKDGKPMVNVRVSQAEIEAANNENRSFETSDTETEGVYVDENTAITEDYAKGIWQIIKLAMDSDVQDYMLYDATVSLQTGSILGFFNKACQRPLVEFFGDTFGDQYYFIVRRPPFDRKLMERALNNQYLLDSSLRSLENKLTDLKTEADDPSWDFEKDWKANYEEVLKFREKYGFGSEYWNKINELEREIRSKQDKANGLVDNYIIRNCDIINSNISFNNQGIYSWYQYYPQFDMSGDEMQYLVPAVLFPEYAAIWGSRALTIQSQYRSFRGTGARDDVKNGKPNQTADEVCSNVLDDMRYLIESNAYAPFVRQGSITIAGTRRLKRGMFIQAEIEKGIDEIFHIDSVTQNYSINGNTINRTTTLNVSRGMVKRFISRQEQKFGNFTYFDIIDFGDEVGKEKKQVTVNTWRDTISKWKVNREVFTFFLKRQQFITGSGGVF